MAVVCFKIAYNASGLCVVALSRNLKLTTTLDRAITQSPCWLSVKITIMKSIQMFFEMLINYQQIKNEMRINLEKCKVQIRIYYAERMKELHTK